MSIERYGDLAARVLRAPPRLGKVRVVAVDGPAGSGKTTFAGRLGRALRGQGVDVAEVHTDDLLEGWTDMVSFWPRLMEWVVEPLRRGEPGRYRVYDWHAKRFEDEWRPLPVPDVLIVEGVTSARSEAGSFLTFAILVDAPADLRLARGLERDGEWLRDDWLRWMADEDLHYAADRTAGRTDLVVDGAPTASHDPESEYVGLPSGSRRGTIRG